MLKSFLSVLLLTCAVSCTYLTPDKARTFSDATLHEKIQEHRWVVSQGKASARQRENLRIMQAVLDERTTSSSSAGTNSAKEEGSGADAEEAASGASSSSSSSSYYSPSSPYEDYNSSGSRKTVRVKSYYRKDGTYVRGHYRSRR